MDAATFDTCVLLGQGQADRFAQATAGDRKKILGQVLGLDVYERAEARAREEARDVEGRTAADRAAVGRLDAELTSRDDWQGRRSEAERQDSQAAQSESEQRTELARLQAEQIELAAKAAEAEAATRAVTDAEAKLADVAERYRRVAARKAEATARLATSEQALAALTADDYVPPADVPALEAEIARLERAEAQDRELERSIATNGAALEAQRTAYDRIVADWEWHRSAAERRVAEAKADLDAPPLVTCPKCSATYTPTEVQAAALTKLQAADRALGEIGKQPDEPVHLAVESGKLERLRLDRVALDWDPETLAAARRNHRLALAARETAAAIETNREVAALATAAINEADAELARITAAGTAARTALTDATTRAEAGAAVAEQLRQLRIQIVPIEGRLAETANLRRSLTGDLAQAVAMLERLDRLAAERDTLAAGLADADARLARLRKLVTAFSVKGIPARIIESVLPELAGSANDLLAQLRPGMTLDIRAQRAKADGKGIVEALDLIVSDDAGERGLAMFSGGERMSVSLALAVALSRLVARRAGTAIRTLCVDEPDGLDGPARQAFGLAVRILAHQGELERVMVVSHHPDLAEFGDAIFEVTKRRNGSSHVEQIA